MSVVRRAQSRTIPLALGALAALGAIAVLVAWLFSSAPQPGEGASQSAPLARDVSVERALEAREAVVDAPDSELESALDAPERVETDAPPPELLVSVFSGVDGRALSQAEVWLLDDSGARTWSAWTDDEGQCLVPAAARLGAVFVQARAQNFFEAVEPLEPTASTAKLVLESALVSRPIRISGVVERVGEKSSGEGAWVLLSSARRTEPSGEEVLQLLAGGVVEGLQLVRTDERGLFSFEVESQAGPFTLRAGARGWAMQSPREARDGVYTILRLSRLHGARVRIVDGESGVDAASLSALRAAVLELSTRATTWNPSEATLALAGVGAAELAPQPSVLRYVLHDPAALERSGPHRLQLRLPGFEPATHEFEATALEIGFADSEVRLVRTATGFGRLRVHLGDASPMLRDAMQGATLPGVLLLRSESSKRSSYACTLALDAPALIEGVPFGEYEVEFAGSPLHLGANAPTIVASSQTDVWISLAPCGAARIRARTRDGAGLKEVLECSLVWSADAPSGRGSSSGSVNASLRAAPKLLAPLMAGEYALHHARIVHGETSGSAPFVVRAGELSEVEVLLGP